MNIEKLPSGSYRIRVTERGKKYAITVPYKPTKKEAFELIERKIKNDRGDITLDEAYKKYIDAKSNVLSPSTLRGYASIYRNMPGWILETNIGNIDDYTMQRVVNEYAAEHSPKSTSNLYSLILTVIRLFNPRASIYATLPQKPRIEPYTPSQEDVMKLLEHAEPTPYYIPLYLMCLSLRVSEACALTIDDLVDDTLTVNKALVRAEKGYILKPTPKTDASNRTVSIPHDLAERIRDQGCVYNGYPQNIDKYLRRTLPKLGIPFFSPHKLRHFFASYCHDLGMSEALIKKCGGWSSDVFKRVYTHAMSVDEAKKTIQDKFDFT